MALIGDIQQRMDVTGPVSSWQAHAPKADLRVKATDGAAKKGAEAEAREGCGAGGDDAPDPEHFKTVIEAVTIVQALRRRLLGAFSLFSSCAFHP